VIRSKNVCSKGEKGAKGPYPKLDAMRKRKEKSPLLRLNKKVAKALRQKTKNGRRAPPTAKSVGGKEWTLGSHSIKRGGNPQPLERATGYPKLLPLEIRKFVRGLRGRIGGEVRRRTQQAGRQGRREKKGATHPLFSGHLLTSKNLGPVTVRPKKEEKRFT